MKRILMIGDDSTLMGMFDATLKRGCPETTVENAMSGACGMQMLNEPSKAFDLVIVTTLRLLDVSSYEILEHLRQKHPRVKVLVFSGGPTPPDEYPMHAFLAKPVSPREFVQTVEQLTAT